MTELREDELFDSNAFDAEYSDDDECNDNASSKPAMRACHRLGLSLRVSHTIR